MSLREEMARKEQERKEKIKKFLYFLIGVGIIISFFNIVVGMVIAIPLIIVLASISAAKDIKHEAQDFAGIIINELSPKIVKVVLPEAERFPEEGIEKEEYLLSEFVDSCDEFKSRDKMIVPLTINGEKVNEIELYDVTHEITEGAKDPFYGIFGRTTLTKDIRSKIKVSTEGKYAFGNVFKHEMDNKYFENVFDVMAMNKNLVGQILTDEVMNFMVEIYKKYNYIVEVSILKNKLNVRVIGKSKIVQTFNGSDIDRIVVDNHYNIMKELVELVHMLYANVDKLEIK
ncbi:MAG: DUF3137 domain-containing protein [Clostridia bacterium]|nr:DUF3137 domain-containing protein [Clostridia bacterium]